MVVGVREFNLEDFTKNIGGRKFYFIEEGIYKLLGPLIINEPNVTLIGTGNVTLVKASKENGVDVSERGEGFFMLNIKIVDNVDNNDDLPENETLNNADNDGFCLVVKVNNTLIEYCYFD